MLLETLTQAASKACLGVALLIIAGATSPSMAAPRRFSAEDLPGIVRITDPQISPDNKTVAVVVSRANLVDDRWDNELTLADIATRQLRAVTHGQPTAGSPRWSPSGEKIAYLAEDPAKTPQIFVAPAAGGDAVQVTHSKTAVTLFAWRPDGLGFAYAADEAPPERTGEAKFDDGFEVGNNNYTERSRRLPTHLWTLNLADGATKRLTSGDWSIPHFVPPGAPPSQINWTRDGRSVVFLKADTALTGDVDSARLMAVDVATGAVRPLAPATAPQDHPMLSPDGGRLAYISARDGHRASEDAAWVTSLAGGQPTEVSHNLDHHLTLAGWSPDGKSLVVTGPDGTRTHMWVQTIGGAAKAVELGALDPSGQVAVGQAGGIAFAATDPTQPAELFYLPKPGAKPIQLSHLQTVTDGVVLGRQETVQWSNDNLSLDGVLTYPPDYVPGKKLPLVLYIHGGPVATSEESFSPSSQILAAQGWLVFEPNYRGSSNHGNAVQIAIHNDSSAGPGRDIMAGLATLTARGIVDEKRIAVSGWSYGGQMTSWLIGAYPEVWRAAVAGAPVTDLVDQYSLSDNNTLRAAAYGPSPFVGDVMKAYQSQSPITFAWRMKAPTLIMSDVGDWRVVTTEAYKLYHALRDNNVPVKFIAYPVPGHSPADPIRARDVWRRWTAWLSPYLAEGG